MNEEQLISESNSGNIFKGSHSFHDNSSYTIGLVDMSLRDLELKQSYDSGEDDILQSFYIPALSQSVMYRRLAGFFSSSALSIAARGLANFIANEGHMELVVGARLKEADINAIREGLESPEQVLEKMMLDDLESIENEFVKDHVRALAWMVANRRLDIKVAVPTDTYGIPLDEEKIRESGMFHMKVGILIDKEGNEVSFSGSVNESATAWQLNIEEFKVFRSWVDGELGHLKSDVRKFEKYWFGNGKNVKIMDIPNAVKQQLIRIAPENIDELKYVKKGVITKDVIKLREYQNEAIKNWFENGKIGIFAMATGTGKTITALACLDKLRHEEKKVGVVIVTPQNTITNQWIIGNLKLFNLEGEEVYGCSKKMLDKLANKILDLNNNLIKYFIIGTTYDTFCKQEFIEEISKCDVPLLLIADEVHNAATPESKQGLLDIYNFRLGLSATPHRYFDDEGTHLIYDYFYKSNYDESKGDTFTFDIKRAITEVNPDTGETYLTPYDYFPFLCELTNAEFKEFEYYSNKISVEYHIALKTGDYKRYNQLLNKRKDIIKNASNKIEVCRRILSQIKNIKKCLFFLDTNNQIENLKQMINIHFPYITYKTFTTEAFQANHKIKLKNLDEFSKGYYDVLLSINCFTEGIDVPSIENAVFVASSTNPKEFIQRRGRVLRRSPGKQKALIYDILVVPSIKSNNISSEDMKLTKSLLMPELKRYKIFAEDSLNKTDSFKLIMQVLNRYNISFGDV